jgi:hypothetical protein
MQKTPSIMLVMMLTYLMVYPCFSEPMQNVALSNYSNQIKSTPFAAQLFIAALLKIDAKVDITTLNCFSPPVITCIKGATTADVVIQLTAAAMLTAVIDVCIRLTALCRSNPNIYKIFLGKAADCDNLLTKFWAACKDFPIVKACLDVKLLPNFGSALVEAGLVLDLVIINLAILIVICLVFGDVFVVVLKACLPALISVCLDVVLQIQVLICSISALLYSLLSLVVGFVANLLLTVTVYLKGFVFLTLYSCVKIIFPSLLVIYAEAFLESCVPFGAKLPMPSTNLNGAQYLWTLLNCF